MEFLIFILIVCIIFFYYEFKSLKDKTNDLKNQFEINSKENIDLKKELIELKKLTDAQFTVLHSALSSKESQPIEPPPAPEPVIVKTKRIFDIKSRIQNFDIKEKIKNEAQPFIDRFFSSVENPKATQTPKSPEAPKNLDPKEAAVFPDFKAPVEVSEAPEIPEFKISAEALAVQETPQEDTSLHTSFLNTTVIAPNFVNEPISAPDTSTSLNTDAIPVIEPIFESEQPYEVVLDIKPRKTIVEDTNERSFFYTLMKKTEKQFADNWTGILGTAIMVLGIGYLSIYTALQVEPIYRLFILWIYAGLLMGSFYFLKKRHRWYKTGLWFRSGGASLFLFGCFGASQIPELAFTNTTSIGYGLIALGIALNLYVGYVIKQETFLSFHVILSMLVLCVIPDKMLTTILVASSTCTAGIILSYKQKWEYHLLVVIFSFALFDLWFYFSGSSLTASENTLAILAVILVGVSCLLMQYRNIYLNSVFEKTAFITHITNWVLFATGLFLHATGNKFKAFIFIGSAFLCLFLAINARKKKIYWLYHLDGMIAFVLCVLGIIMLNDWQVGVDKIFTLLYLLIVTCLVIVYQKKEFLLHQIFLGINNFFAFIVVLAYLLFMNKILAAPTEISLLLSATILALIGFSIPLLSGLNQTLTHVDDLYGLDNVSLNGLVSIVFSVISFYYWSSFFSFSFYYILLFLVLVWCFAKEKINSITFDLGRLYFFGLSIFSCTYLIFNQEQLHSDWVLLYGLLLVMIYNWKLKEFLNNDWLIRQIAIFGFNMVLVLLVYKYLKAYSIAPMMVLLLLAIVNYEFLCFNLNKKSINNQNQIGLFLAYCIQIVLSSVAFLIQSFELQCLDIFLVCLSLTIVEAYVLFYQRLKPNLDNAVSVWQQYSYINSEMILFNFLLFGFSCLALEYIALFLGGLAVLSYYGFQKCTEFKYYNNYSFLLLMGSMMTTIYFVLAPVSGVNQYLLYFSQAFSILFSILYSYLQYKNTNQKENTFAIVFPYIQNFWIFVLLAIQVELVWLPILFTMLALLNYVLITAKITTTNRYFVVAISSLSIVISLFYSFTHFYNFDAVDWILQFVAFGLGVFVVYFMSKREENPEIKTIYQIVLNAWLSFIMLSQLAHQYLPVFWAALALINLYLYHKKTTNQKKISIVYYLLANIHLGVLSFVYYELSFLYVYLLLFMLLGGYVYIAYKWIENFDHKNDFLIFPATLSIGSFLFLTFDKGVLTFFWILESLGLLILGVMLKEKFFRYVSLSLVGICVIRLLFFDLSNANFLIRALVLVGVGVVMIIMNTIFKKYKHRFNDRN